MPTTRIRRLTYRGRHRRSKFSPTVFETIAEARRIPIEEVFAMRDAMWNEMWNEMWQRPVNA